MPDAVLGTGMKRGVTQTVPWSLSSGDLCSGRGAVVAAKFIRRKDLGVTIWLEAGGETGD